MLEKLSLSIQKMAESFKGLTESDNGSDMLYIDEQENPAVKAVIRKGVLEYNAPFLGEWKPKTFTLYVKTPAGNVIGGIYGDYVNQYMRVNWVWVEEKERLKGIGRGLFQALEVFSKEKKCQFIQLDTFEFQAKAFYEKIGFKLISTLPNWANGHACHIMRKEI